MVVRTLTFNSRASFKRQLISFFVVSLIILAVTTSVITAWQASLQIRSSTIDNGVQVTQNFADQSVLALLTDSEENAQEAVTRALGFQMVDGVAVYRPNGELLIASVKSAQKKLHFEPGKVADSAQLMREGNAYWVFGAPVFFEVDEDDPETVEPEDDALEKQIIGYVLVEYGKRASQQIQRAIFVNNIAIGGLIAVLLALFMSWGINRLTRPLSRLSQTMDAATTSDDYPRADIDGALEIRQMAEMYNRMMGRLARQNAELQSHRDTLESEVEIRTQELKVARDTALTASRHKSEFLANISHELRTPLQSIIGYTDLVREELELECMDQQVEDLSKSIRSAQNLQSLINNILDLAKIEAGRMDLYLKPVDLAQLIEDVTETVRPMAITNNNRLIIERGKLSRSLILDRQKLVQILLNLLSNACKFTQNGRVVFSIHNDSQCLYFSISDTGVGIPEDKLEYIFEQFTQVDGSQTRHFEGTGLGMAITKTFCELMNGNIQVESEHQRGTTFSVVLPLSEHS